MDLIIQIQNGFDNSDKYHKVNDDDDDERVIKSDYKIDLKFKIYDKVNDDKKVIYVSIKSGFRIDLRF